MRKTILLTYFLSVFGFLSTSAQAVEWKDVASIFYDNCATCHRPGEIGDGFIYANSYKALVSDPFGYFTLIPYYVENKLMPPWKADPSYHHFLDERILSQHEIDLVDSFVSQVSTLGTAYNPGDTSLAPPPPYFASGSQLGVPDTILTMAQPFTIPGDYQDHYQVFVLHTNLTSDTNVKAIEFRAGNAQRVHHVFIYTCTDGSADSMDAATPEYGYPSFGGAGEGVNVNFLTLSGPGLTPRFYPEGTGLKFKAGTTVVIQVHYAPTFEETTDQSSVNIFWESNPDIRHVKGKRVGEDYKLEPGPLFIPKNKIVTFHSEYTLDTTYSMFSIAPHMHLLGKAFKIWAEEPNGDSIPLCYVPAWDFKWQLLYNFCQYIILPQGTVIKSEATYDNTTNNPNNPNNPPQNVEYGESSFDEMDKYFMNLVPYALGDELVVFDTACIILDVPPVVGIISTPQLYSPIPNPAASDIAFTYYLPNYGSAHIKVYDLTGRMTLPVIEENSLAPGFHKQTLDVSTFIPGMYFFTLEANGRRVTKPFIVQH